jgi:hypothetical protein
MATAQLPETKSQLFCPDCGAHIFVGVCCAKCVLEASMKNGTAVKVPANLPVPEGYTRDPISGKLYTGIMETMDSSGDLKLMWDRNNADEVQHARETFNNLTKAKAHVAFVAKADGSQGRRMDEFDPAAERMIMVKQYQGG